MRISVKNCADSYLFHQNLILMQAPLMLLACCSDDDDANFKKGNEE